MEFDFTWLLLGLPVAFVLGWVAARFDLKQLKRESRESPKAYFKGLNFLLNEQPDKAIDAFIEAVQNDPDTAELHFALGNLFRRRGEIERAVRVHQHLHSRADIGRAERDRAQHALAQDYLKAGLFDRAEEAYQALRGSVFDIEAQIALLGLHERSRDWRAAIDTATALERAGAGSFAARIAHHWCELADQAQAAGRDDEAAAALRHAREAAPAAPRPLLMIGQRAARAGDAAGAIAAYDDLRRRDLATFSLVAADYAEQARACGREVQARAALAEAYSALPGVDLLRALAMLDTDPAASAERLAAHLQRDPTLGAARLALEGDAPLLAVPGMLPGVAKAVAAAAVPLQRYRCAACGFESQRYFWQCPGCLSWDSLPPRRVEEL